MLKRFIPDKYIRSFRDLDVEALKKAGIKLVICDIDNTLVAHDEALPNEDVFAFVEKVRESGLQLCLISNNNKERVRIFAKPLDLHHYGFAKKPLRFTYRKIQKDYAMKDREIAAIGDQLLTDIFGGNRMHHYTILSQPLVEKDLKYTKINRVFEQMIFKRLEKKKKLIRGTFDE